MLLLYCILSSFRKLANLLRQSAPCQVYLIGKLLPRDQVMMSELDSALMLGDTVTDSHRSVLWRTI